MLWLLVLGRGLVVGGGVAVVDVRGVGVLEVKWWIMAWVDMVCVHDMTVACIAHGWKELEEAQRVGWAHGGGNKDRAEGAGRDDGGAGGRGKRKRARRREGDGRERASTERWDALSRGRRETETRQPIITLYFPHYFPYPPHNRCRNPPFFPFGGYSTPIEPPDSDTPTLPTTSSRMYAHPAQAGQLRLPLGHPPRPARRCPQSPCLVRDRMCCPIAFARLAR